MIIISHRGYIKGIDKSIENNPTNILRLLKKKIHVEIDVRFYKNSFYLGHDKPQYKIDTKFLQHKNLWCHLKDANALKEIKSVKCHYFWHQEDDYTLTSKGYIWVYPGKSLIKNSIAVLPEKFNQDTSICKGVCTDFIKNYFKNL